MQTNIVNKEFWIFLNLHEYLYCNSSATASAWCWPNKVLQSTLTFPDWYKPTNNLDNQEPNNKGPNGVSEDCGVFVIKTNSNQSGINDVGCNVLYSNQQLLRTYILCEATSRILISLHTRTEQSFGITNNTKQDFPQSCNYSVAVTNDIKSDENYLSTNKFQHDFTKSGNYLYFVTNATNSSHKSLLETFLNWKENPLFFPLLGTSALALISSSCLIIYCVCIRIRSKRLQPEATAVMPTHLLDSHTQEAVSSITVTTQQQSESSAYAYDFTEYSAYAPLSDFTNNALPAATVEFEGIYDSASISPTNDSAAADGATVTNIESKSYALAPISNKWVHSFQTGSAAETTDTQQHLLLCCPIHP